MTAGFRGLREWLRGVMPAILRPTLLLRGVAMGRLAAFSEPTWPGAVGRATQAFRLPNDPTLYDGEDLGQGLFALPGGTLYAGGDAGGRALERDFLDPELQWEADL